MRAERRIEAPPKHLHKVRRSQRVFQLRLSAYFLNNSTSRLDRSMTSESAPLPAGGSMKKVWPLFKSLICGRYYRSCTETLESNSKKAQVGKRETAPNKCSPYYMAFTKSLVNSTILRGYYSQGLEGSTLGRLCQKQYEQAGRIDEAFAWYPICRTLRTAKHSLFFSICRSELLN